MSLLNGNWKGWIQMESGREIDWKDPDVVAGRELEESGCCPRRRLEGMVIGRVGSRWGLERKNPMLLEGNSDAVAGSGLDVTVR